MNPIEKNTLQETILPIAFIRNCYKQRRKVKVMDSLGTELTGGLLLVACLTFRKVLRREIFGNSDEEKNVGILLPPSGGAVIANATLSIDSRVPVNLNYTLSLETINHCLRAASIKHILTTKKILERLPYNAEDLEAKVVLMEEMRDKSTKFDKLTSLAATYLNSPDKLAAKLKLDKLSMDDLCTIIFTSGSTGVPKGVMLTYLNIGSNIGAFFNHIRIYEDDVFLGVLPFFHSFGYTTTLWTTLVMPLSTAYHITPLEPRQIGKLAEKYGATVLIATPTFLRSYCRRISKEQFAKMDIIVAGAEKLPLELVKAYEDKFDVQTIEGYGATELSPVVCSNVPVKRDPRPNPLGIKEGTIGLPMPGIEVRIIDLDTGEVLPKNTQGMLQVRGPSVMKGYLGLPEETAKVIDPEGWYTTNDVAIIDEDGCIKITGRLSRFSKIGGEMVPHLIIEETLQEILDIGDAETMQVAIASRPHETKGEEIIVLYNNELEIDPSELTEKLKEAGLPAIWCPSPSNYFPVEEIPCLATGKLDLAAVKQMAQEI